MELQITSEIDSKLLSRKEILGKLVYDGVTPSREKLIDAIASKYKANKDNILINKMKCHIGVHECEINLYIYDDKESMDRYTKKGKKQIEKEKKLEEERKKAEEEKKKAQEEKKKAEKEAEKKEETETKDAEQKESSEEKSKEDKEEKKDGE